MPIPRPRLRAVQVTLFLWLWGAFCYFSHGPGWGPLSRLNLVLALVGAGTVVVDRYRENTGDNGLHRGHYYHAKAPGGALLGLPPYRVFRWLTPRPALAAGPAWSRYVGRSLYAVTCFSSALLSALAGVILFRLAWELFGRPSAALGAVVLYAFATNVLIYSAVFEAHQMAGALMAMALYLCWRARAAAGRTQVFCLLGAGVAAGFAVATEFQDLFIVLALAVYLFAVLPARRRMGWLLPGAIVPIALVMAHNWAAFDSPFTVGYAHQAPPWDELHRGALLGFGPPRATVLWQLLAGGRTGVFLYTPAAALAILGAVLWRRSGRHRAERLLAVAVCVLFPVYLSGFGNALSGTQFGPRLLVAVLPFACVMMVPAVIRVPRLCATVGVISGVLVLAGAAVCPEVTSGPAPPLLNRVLLPLVAGDFPQSIYGFVANRCPRPIHYRPFNLGTLMGLRSHASLLPYLAWWLIGFLGIRRLLKGKQVEGEPTMP